MDTTIAQSALTMAQALQAIARAHQSSIPLAEAVAECVQAVVTLGLGVLTFITLRYLKKYTKAAQDQVREAHAQNQKTARLVEAAQDQTEHSFMPILSLTWEPRGDGRNCLVVRNVGSAPAFNAVTKSTTSTKCRLDLIHPPTVAAGEAQGVMYRVEAADPGFQPAWIKDIQHLLNNVLKDHIICARLTYDSATGKSYETRHSLVVATHGGLDIHFDGFGAIADE